MINKLTIIAYLCLVIKSQSLLAQNPERPFIWVKKEDRTKILNKIETQSWAKKTYTSFIKKLDDDIRLHQLDHHKFLEKLPLDWEKAKPNEMPPFYKTYHIENGIQKNLDNITEEEFKKGRQIIHYLDVGINSGIAYYLTKDEKYAQCAIDILNLFVKGVSQSEVSQWKTRGGWLFPYDGFREVREVGARLPIIYDFVASFVPKGGKPYDIIKKKKVDFPFKICQKVFKTYANITINYGQINSNHPVLEAPNLVYNALAIDDVEEREKLLSYFLTENTANQDALKKMASIYKEEGDIWPETSQYFNHATSIITRLMFIVNRYNPDLRLGEKYSNVLFALPKLNYLVYPNNEIIRWGDGKRKGSPSYVSCEDAYLLGQMDQSNHITSKFGPILRRAIKEGKYNRTSMYSVLNHGVDLPLNMNEFELPRTDQVAHAGIFLQRNLSSTNNPIDGLMCFVGGAHMVHGHAEGMNIELYGKGQVLGVDNGRGSYQKDIHENYSRIYAAHNTVIVNGASQGSGGWVNLGINKVQLIAMEPKPFKTAMSPYHSFTKTSFIDDKGDKAEAKQERTLALIRTSPTTGYYVDVFRSKSKLPNEYHDYLYHNIGDKLNFLNKDLILKNDNNRYMDNANSQWVHNKIYRNPGWHFFKDVKSSNTYALDVKARFNIKKLKSNNQFMNLFIIGNKNREYTKVKAPKTFEAPEPYDKLPTPTLVIRQKGEAWTNPFAVVYEPTFDEKLKNTAIQSVTKLENSSIFKGVEVISKINNRLITQYVITQQNDFTYKNEELGFYFKGAFAVITVNESKSIQSIYIGEGVSFKSDKIEVYSKNNLPISVYVDFSNKEYTINTSKNTDVKVLTKR